MTKPVNKPKIAVRLLLVCLLISLVFHSWQLALLSKRLEAIRKAGESPVKMEGNWHQSQVLGHLCTKDARLRAPKSAAKTRKHRRHYCSDMSVHPIYLPYSGDNQ